MSANVLGFTPYMITTFLATKTFFVPWDLVKKMGVKLQGHS